MKDPNRTPPTQAEISSSITMACMMECTAAKPGNVHPNASFADVTYRDFVKSAVVSAPILAQASSIGVGQSILDAVLATREAVGSNTNLGMLLLLGPLAAIPGDRTCKDGIRDVLANLTTTDTEMVYSAIRHAKPGGLGKVSEGDVASTPTITLLEGMKLAADRDLIAKQYVTAFEDVFAIGVETFCNSIQLGLKWEPAVIATQLAFMSRYPDSLIARKCGQELAQEAQQRAQDLLQSDWDRTLNCPRLQEFDAWLRADGNKRNPGTTADLIAASLFVIQRDNLFPLPGVQIPTLN